MKVEIRTVTVVPDELTSDYDYEARERTDVLVDGVLVAQGGYGGEPEDNMRCRDYSWVEPALVKLATALGADVQHTKQRVVEEW